MPASLYESYHHTNNMDRISNTDLEDNRAVKLAYELAMLGLDTSLGAAMEGHHNTTTTLEINSRLLTLSAHYLCNML